MLQLVDIRKAYTTGSFTQVALDDVSVAFRDNEFAAILGPSGSGKTTLLNILGGLDHADSGDIVINGVSTKDYNDKDWDAYRNHRIGFIFQSYNLIPHQTVLSNVELALTLAGEPVSKRRERALAALGRVGLAEHANKRPSQLSGGQMQRVAIARALVNDPDIVLADEPTGALDTETGIQVMNLLAEIARDRLVVMVTHNPELADEYATRTIRLTDGRIVDDTNPLDAARGGHAPARPLVVGLEPARAGTQGRVPHVPTGRHDGAGAHFATPTQPSVSDATRHASMGFLTALALSFNNLMTKKGRTFMTAFAGSIGIIGIAAILALSNGVNDYIATTEEEALSSYPLTITKSSFDISNLMLAGMAAEEAAQSQDADGRVIPQHSIMGDMFAKVKNNDLRSFRAFLESGESGMEPYVNSIQYSYGLTPNIYKADTSKGVVRLNPSRMSQTLTNGLSGSAFLGGSSMSSFTELLGDRRILEQSLSLVEGRWPEAYDECVFVMSRRGTVSDYTLYSLGFYDPKVMDAMMTQALNGEEVEVPKTDATFTRDDALGMHFAVIPACELYQRNDEQGTWSDMTGDGAYMRRAIADAVDLHVVGIVQQADSASSSGIPEGIGYTPALTLHLMERAAAAPIVAQQRKSSKVDVFTGKTFEELKREENRSFDMESMFKVDEDALKQAFAFDESALSGLGQDLDLSNVDFASALQGMDLSSLDFSDMDLSGIDTSALASAFDASSMGDIMGGAPRFTGEGLDLPDSGFELTDAQTKQLATSGGKLVDGFVSWLAESGALSGENAPDFAALARDYLQTGAAQQIVSSLADELGKELTPEEVTQATQVLSNYLTSSLAPYLSSAVAGLDPSQITEETLRKLIDEAPELDFDALGEALGTQALVALAQSSAGSLAADFSSWLLKHPEYLSGGEGDDKASIGDLVAKYLETDSAKKIVDNLVSNVGGSYGQEVSDAISGAMANYMQNQFAPYIAKQFERMFAQMAEGVGKQLAQVFAREIGATMAQATGQIGGAISDSLQESMGQVSSQLASAMQGALSVDADAFARAIQFNMTQEDLASLLSNYMNADELTYESNLKKLGFAEVEAPEAISIYPIDFPAKEEVLHVIDGYNDRMTAEGKPDSAIQYTDFAGVLMGSVTDIVNTISLVLIAFVSISLVVSSIMISIITYISVLERKKEIGILRAMGASKLNVANIFNAETVIEGFFAGTLAIAVVYAVSVPVNIIVYKLKDVPNIMQLSPQNAITLVAISVALTLIAGLIPSSAAARRDPVEALRSE